MTDKTNGKNYECCGTCKSEQSHKHCESNKVKMLKVGDYKTYCQIKNIK